MTTQKLTKPQIAALQAIRDGEVYFTVGGRLCCIETGKPVRAKVPGELFRVYQGGLGWEIELTDAGRAALEAAR